MRLMFVARAIDWMPGGVERMITMVMDAMAARGHDVDLLTWDLAGAEAFYPMDSGITWHRLGMGDPRVRASNMLRLRRFQAVRALIGRRKPQVIVCFQDGPFMAICAYTLGFQIPIIVSERNAPTRFDHIAVNLYRKFTYPSFRLAARIAIQFESYRALYPNYLQGRIVCIPNPVLTTAARAQPDVSNRDSRYRLLSVGRLGFQKNYKVLIGAFARLAAKFPNWDLTIVGEGEDRAKLETLIRTHNLTDRVTLPGATRSIAQWYTKSHLFCLPSRWEGFPNAMAEALAHGLPAVGFAECAGVQDLIVHGHSGLLAEGNGEVGSLAVTLETTMSSRTLRRLMGTAAIESMRRFDAPRIFSQWEQLLLEVAHH